MNVIAQINSQNQMSEGDVRHDEGHAQASGLTETL